MKTTTSTLKKVRINWQLYLFLLLPLLYIIIFAYVPMLGIQIAFKKYNFNLGIWGSPWIGLRNFHRFFTSYQFSRVLTNTLSLSFYGLIAGFPIPILFALMLNSMRNEKFKKIIQTTTYIPYFISTVVIVGMLLQIINPRVGLYGTAYLALTGKEAPDLMSQASVFPHLYVWSGIWQGMGWNAIIYIAALANVDPELHEAAQIDGASRFKRVLHIDFPSILPTAVIMLILSAGTIMSIGFEKIFLMQNTMNLSASEVISTYVYKSGLSGATGDFSYATAIGLFNSVVNLILLQIVNTISKKVSSQSLW